MGSAVLLLSASALLLIFGSSSAAGSSNCPLPSKVYSCSPKCIENYECSHGKVCCPNSCNAKSCSEPAPYGGSSGSDKYAQSRGAGIYCNNVKCSPYEVCKMDPITKIMKCQRA